MRLLNFSLFLLLSCPLFAQYQIGLVPRESPDRGIYHQIGFTEIELRYGSPSTKNRVIWGDLVPYDEVWRAGANWATTISFSEDVLIEGEALAAGQYALFKIPKKHRKWTVIFSKKAKQWGSFSYNPEENALSVEILPFEGPFTNQLSYHFESLGFEYGRLLLQWERLQIPITINTQYLDILKNKPYHLHKCA